MLLKLPKIHPAFMSFCTQSVQICEKFAGYIPIKAVEIKYSHSSGPGGQNINARQTKVEIKFKVNEASWIPNDIKEKIREKHMNKINGDGFLIIKSDKTRYQLLNQADCFDKLRTLVWNAQSAGEEAKATISKQLDEEEVFKQRQEGAARERLKIKRQRSVDKEFRRAETV